MIADDHIGRRDLLEAGARTGVGLDRHVAAALDVRALDFGPRGRLGRDGEIFAAGSVGKVVHFRIEEGLRLRTRDVGRAVEQIDDLRCIRQCRQRDVVAAYRRPFDLDACGCRAHRAERVDIARQQTDVAGGEAAGRVRQHLAARLQFDLARLESDAAGIARRRAIHVIAVDQPAGYDDVLIDRDLLGRLQQQVGPGHGDAAVRARRYAGVATGSAQQVCAEHDVQRIDQHQARGTALAAIGQKVATGKFHRIPRRKLDEAAVATRPGAGIHHRAAADQCIAPGHRDRAAAVRSLAVARRRHHCVDVEHDVAAGLQLDVAAAAGGSAARIERAGDLDVLVGGDVYATGPLDHPASGGHPLRIHDVGEIGRASFEAGTGQHRSGDAHRAGRQCHAVDGVDAAVDADCRARQRRRTVEQLGDRAGIRLTVDEEAVDKALGRRAHRQRTSIHHTASADHETVRIGEEHVSADASVADRVQRAVDVGACVAHDIHQIHRTGRHVQIRSMRSIDAEGVERVETRLSGHGTGPDVGHGTGRTDRRQSTAVRLYRLRPGRRRHEQGQTGNAEEPSVGPADQGNKRFQTGLAASAWCGFHGVAPGYDCGAGGPACRNISYIIVGRCIGAGCNGFSRSRGGKRHPRTEAHSSLRREQRVSGAHGRSAA